LKALSFAGILRGKDRYLRTRFLFLYFLIILILKINLKK